MKTEKNTAERRLPDWLPGLVVLLVVLVLLRGFGGAWETVCVQVRTLAASLLGGPDTVGAVVWHTLPLGLAAAGIAFAVAAGWMRFESFGSVVAAALIVLGAAFVGGELRSMAIEPAASLATIQGPIVGAIARPTEPPPEKRLAGVDWLAEPRLEEAPARIEPLALMPEASGVLGFVCRAVNQLLGYLVAYNPRLLLASLLAGGYVGWSWQRRLVRWGDRLTAAKLDGQSPPTRRAA